MAWAVGLGHISVAAGRQRLGLVPSQCIRSYCNDRDRLQVGIGSYPPCRLVAVHNGQLNVHQDQVRTLLSDRSERLFAVLRFDQLISSVAQQITQDLPVVHLILDHQNASAHQCPTCVSTLTGTVKANVDPCPSSDWTQSRPPCISMIRLAIASPRTVPAFCLVSEEAACWNSSKILP